MSINPLTISRIALCIPAKNDLIHFLSFFILLQARVKSGLILFTDIFFYFKPWNCWNFWKLLIGLFSGVFFDLLFGDGLIWDVEVFKDGSDGNGNRNGNGGSDGNGKRDGNGNRAVKDFMVMIYFGWNNSRNKIFYTFLFRVC